MAAASTAAQRAMPHPGLRAGFDAGVARLLSQAGVNTLVAPPHADAAPRPRLLATDGATFVASPALHEEVFGPAALVVTVRSLDETLAVLRAVEGSLTFTLRGAADDSADNRRLVRAARQLAGRVRFGGVPTGLAGRRARPGLRSLQPTTQSGCLARTSST